MMDRVFDLYVSVPQQKFVFDILRAEADRDPYGVAEARRMLDAVYPWLDERMEPGVGGRRPVQPGRLRGGGAVLCRLDASAGREVRGAEGLSRASAGPCNRSHAASTRRGPGAPISPLGAPDG